MHRFSQGLLRHHVLTFLFGTEQWWRYARLVELQAGDEAVAQGQAAPNFAIVQQGVLTVRERAGGPIAATLHRGACVNAWALLLFAHGDDHRAANTAPGTRDERRQGGEEDHASVWCCLLEELPYVP